jgi:phage tail tape-measure protein
MLGEGRRLVNPSNDGILGGAMLSRIRCLAGCLAVLFLVAGCGAQVPRYAISPAKGQTSQQMDSDKFDCNLQAQKQTDYNPDKALTEGALVGLLVGGAAGAGLGAAAGAAGGIVGTGASVGAIAGGGVGATLGGSYLYDKDLNQTQRAYCACLETRGYTLTK